MKWHRLDFLHFWRMHRRRRRAANDEFLRRHFRNTVVAGPFAGLSYPDAVAASGSTLAPKLTGSYELEIQPWLEEVIRTQPTHVINIGAGEGYYAVGLAIRLPGARVHAFDPDGRAQETIRALAEANGVGARVRTSAFCTGRELNAMPAGSFVLCDCEGCELELLDPQQAPRLTTMMLLVETHGTGSADTAHELIRRFAPSHRVRHAQYDRRNRRTVAAASLPPGLRAHAVDERRRRGLHWLFLQPRAQILRDASSKAGSSHPVAQ